MRKMLVKAAFGAIACLVMTAGQAAASDVVEVKVPFPFVVRGVNFPAGRYTIERNDMASSVLLIRGDRGNKAATFVETQPAGGHDPAGDMPALEFKRHENEYRLSAVWDSASDGRQLMN